MATGRPLNTGRGSGDFMWRRSQIDLSSLGQDYLERSKALAGGAAHLIDKMPFNFFNAGTDTARPAPCQNYRAAARRNG